MQGFLDGIFDQAGIDVTQRVAALIKKKKLKQQVAQEAQDYAQRHSARTLKPNETPDKFPSVELQSDDRDEFLLVLEYFEAIGLKFTPNVMRYESQNPGVPTEREALCKKYNLRADDDTPLLVQLVQQRLDSLQGE
jgi:hypothetical protein